MGLRKYLGLERQRLSRYPAAIDVQFQVWDSAKQQPRTGKVRGRLTDVSREGACLQTNHTLIEGHHLLLDSDQEGNTPLFLHLESAPGQEPFTLQAQVLWYNRGPSARRYQFDVGLCFLNISTDQWQRLEALARKSPGAAQEA